MLNSVASIIFLFGTICYYQVNFNDPVRILWFLMYYGFSLKNWTSDSHSISRKKDCLWFDLLGKKNLIWIYENIFLILENLGWYFGIHCCLHVPGFEISGRFDIYLSLYTGKIAVTFQWGTNFWNDDVLFICQKMDNYCLIFNPLTYLTNNSTYERCW